MAGYPYTGGIYGGYNDPANNRKKTFIGPDADKKASKAANALTTGVMHGYGNYRQGVEDTLNKTANAYQQGGLPAAAGQYVRGTMGDAGNALKQGVWNPLVAGVVNPALSLIKGASNFAKTLATGDPTPIGEQRASLADAPNYFMPMPESPREHLLASQYAPPGGGKIGHGSPSQQQGLPEGMAFQTGSDGSRTYTMGTPGQDGYGKMVVHGPQTTRDALSQLPPGYVVNGERMTDTNRGIHAQTVGGLSIASTDPSAVDRFTAPINPMPAQKRMVLLDPISPDYQKIWNDDQNQNSLTQLPKYMTREEGRTQGLGWKERRDKYREDLAAYLTRSGQANNLDIAQMQEQGAMDRARMQAQQASDANDITRQRVGGELGLTQANIGLAQLNQQKGQMEIDQAKQMQALNDQYLAEKDPVKQKALGNQILTMQGKSSKDWQITTREEPIDPNNPLAGTVKKPYAINLNDPSQVIEIGDSGTSLPNQVAPKDAIKYLKNNPESAPFFKRKYGYLPEGF